MADYTIELRDVIACGHNIFDFNYPFYDEKKRPEFEEKFIRHFYFREICCPTVDRFKMYLRDKMDTVFPYYNELFKSASIEYSILNNYNLTEEFTTTRENEGKTRGESYTVGQLYGEQVSNTENDRVTDMEGNVTAKGKETDVETSHSETNTQGHSKTDTTNNGTSDTTTHGETSSSESGEDSKDTIRKFLDTPQGLTDLSNSKYLTDLTQTTENGSQEKSGSSESDNVTNTETSSTGSSETNDTGNSVTDATRNGERNTESNQDSTGKETTKDTGTGTVKDEQKTTQDNNTRTFLEGKQTETHKLIRIGNIGVDTDSDMIEKHNRLQKTLKQIELLFFNECEDLFMMVY